MNTDATKDMGGENGLHLGQVAEATLNGIENENMRFMQAIRPQNELPILPTRQQR
jgi:hypothetical protein